MRPADNRIGLVFVLFGVEQNCYVQDFYFSLEKCI